MRFFGRNELLAALRFALIDLLASVVLCACSLKLQIALFNDSGEAVTIALWHKGVAVQPGLSAVFDYPGPNERWQVHIATSACDYIYQVPQAELSHFRNADSKGPLKLQVEKDFTIYALPPSAKDVTSVAELGDLQQDGFPLHPISKVCR